MQKEKELDVSIGGFVGKKPKWQTMNPRIREFVLAEAWGIVACSGLGRAAADNLW